MDETRPSLLVRVKRRDDETAWREFYHLYAPLLERYARKRGLSREEADDVAQECMNILVKKMQGFTYARGKGTFKGYLYRLVCNHIADRVRKNKPRQAASGELRRLEAKDDHHWEKLWLQQHLSFCLGNIQDEFSEITIAAFKLYALREWSVERVCESLGVTANQVYLAKSRVTRRLRKELNEYVGEVF